MDPLSPDVEWSPSNSRDDSPAAQAVQKESVTSPAGRNIVPAACVSCRTKHLRCNGLSPCSRCATQGIDCSYVRSRRGYKGPRRTTKLLGEDHRESTTGRSPMLAGCNIFATTKDAGMVSSEVTAQAQVTLSMPVFSKPVSAIDHYDAAQPPISSELNVRCLEAFFYYFYPAHPFILPRAYHMNLNRDGSLAHLETAMKYVGSYFIKGAPTDRFAWEVIQILSSSDCKKDGFTVQALILVSIALDGNSELKKAAEIMVQAQDLALELGMHRREYAEAHGEGIPVMEESWRRTWWELYVVDGMAAGVHQASSFRLNQITANVLLPCEEQEYLSGRIPTPHSMDEFENQWIFDDQPSFSSFAYRIAAIRNLGRILQLEHVVFDENPIIDQIDACLVNWWLHLPDTKKMAIDGDGQVDEMAFQSLMITNATSIMLHKPFSQLDTSVARDVTSCAPYRPVSGGQGYNTHVVKMMQAADKISKLITLPISLTKHTHFFTCVITLSSIVHLSCWASLLPSSQDEQVKQQIRLNTGALKAISEVWPSAKRVGVQVKDVAQEVYNSRKAATAEGFWEHFTQEEVMRSMIEDERIMNELLLT